MSEEERAEIDRRLERLERRRAEIGPVNPLAEREYDEAREHVEACRPSARTPSGRCASWRR